MSQDRTRKAPREGAPLIVANAARVLLSKTANLYLPPKEGGELVLVLGLMKVIVEEELHDRKFIEDYTQDFAKLERSLQKVNMGEDGSQRG